MFALLMLVCTTIFCSGLLFGGTSRRKSNPLARLARLVLSHCYQDDPWSRTTVRTAGRRTSPGGAGEVRPAGVTRAGDAAGIPTRVMILLVDPVIAATSGSNRPIEVLVPYSGMWDPWGQFLFGFGRLVDNSSQHIPNCLMNQYAVCPVFCGEPGPP